MSAIILPFIRRLPAEVDRGELKTALNIRVPTVIKAAPARLMKINVIRGRAWFYDHRSLDGLGPECLMYVSPEVCPPLPIDLCFPCLNGLTVVPAEDSVIAVLYL